MNIIKCFDNLWNVCRPDCWQDKALLAGGALYALALGSIATFGAFTAGYVIYKQSLAPCKISILDQKQHSSVGCKSILSAKQGGASSAKLSTKAESFEKPNQGFPLPIIPYAVNSCYVASITQAYLLQDSERILKALQERIDNRDKPKAAEIFINYILKCQRGEEISVDDVNLVRQALYLIKAIPREDTNQQDPQEICDAIDGYVFPNPEFNVKGHPAYSYMLALNQFKTIQNQCEISKAPAFLRIMFNRRTHGGYIRDKIGIPHNLSLTDGRKTKNSYALTSAILHSGFDQAGHCIACIARGGKYYYADDLLKTYIEINREKFDEYVSQAYMVFYSRV